MVIWGALTQGEVCVYLCVYVCIAIRVGVCVLAPSAVAQGLR